MTSQQGRGRQTHKKRKRAVPIRLALKTSNWEHLATGTLEDSRFDTFIESIMNNLMDTVPKWAQEDSSSDGGGDDIETPSKQPTTDYMEDFFRHVDSIKADIDAVAKATNDIAKISEQSMRATTTADENKLSKKLKPLIDSTNQRAKKSKNMLGLLKEDTVSLKTAGKLNASDIR